MTPEAEKENQFDGRAELPPTLLHYESADGVLETGQRPRWVAVVAGLYLLALIAFVTFPFWVDWVFNVGDLGWPSAIAVAAMLVCGCSLIIIPIRKIRRRSITRRSIWVPIIGSGLMMGSLVFGGGIAFGEFVNETFPEPVLWCIIAGAIAVWVAWSVLFLLIARRDGATKLGLQLHQWLIAGSVLELLIAVPTHVVVRRRPDCCAGMATGLGICIGVAVVFVSFGPGVLLLYFQRRNRIAPPGHG
jgi:hypothetical protein